MKILYLTNTPFSDLEISYVAELEKLAEVKVLMLMLPNTKKSGAISLDCQSEELEVIPATQYPGMEKYANMLTLNRWAIVNNPIGSNIKTSFLLARKIAKVIKDYQPDILHITFYGLMQVFLNWQLDKTLKKIITVHDVVLHDKTSFIRYWYDFICRRLTLKHFNNILLLSHIDDKILGKCQHSTNHRIFYSQLGPYTYLRNYPIGHNLYGKYILFFGSVRPYKGVDILIEAYKKSNCKSQEIKLVIAGKDIEGNVLHDYQDKDIIILNRYIENDELATLISNSLFAVLPYKSATQSGVTKSAIALDKPMICTNVGNLPNEVIDGRYGKIVNHNDVDDLCDSINYMISHPKQVEEFTENIHSDFETGCNSWVKITEDMVTNVYSTILKDNIQ